LPARNSFMIAFIVDASRLVSGPIFDNHVS
jgi:hypothetical protein